MHKSNHASLHHSNEFHVRSSPVRKAVDAADCARQKGEKKTNYWPRGRFSDTWALINFRSRGQKTDIRLKKGSILLVTCKWRHCCRFWTLHHGVSDVPIGAPLVVLQQ